MLFILHVFNRGSVSIKDCSVFGRVVVAGFVVANSYDYLRFRNSFSPSISVMYVNPASISCVASLMLVAVLHVYSSSPPIVMALI